MALHPKHGSWLDLAIELGVLSSWESTATRRSNRSVTSWPDNLSWINARGGRHAAPTARISQSVAR